MSSAQTVRADRRTLEIHGPDKVLFPGDGGGDAARRWSVADAVEQARTDPWQGLLKRGRALGPARRRLDAVRG